MLANFKLRTMKTHNNLRKSFALFFMFNYMGMSGQDSDASTFLRDDLMVYYVEDPSSDQYRLINPNEITSGQLLFGGNPEMEIAQNLVRDIFIPGSDSDFQQSVMNALSNHNKPLALFLYYDRGPLDESAASANWTNCLENGHFTSCVTAETGDEYERVVHYGANQMNADGLVLAKNRFIELIGIESSINNRPAINLPTGKGMFIENLVGAEPSPEAFVQRAHDNGISWIAFQGENQDLNGVNLNEKNASTRITREYVSAFQNAIPQSQVYTWGWPMANSSEQNLREFIDHLIEKAEWVNANGIILDIEGKIGSNTDVAWNVGNKTDKMRFLMIYALQEAHSREMLVAVSSFGTNVHNFPWSEMKRADFGIPQLYAPSNHIFDESGRVKEEHREYVLDGITNWQDETRGFRNRVVVALATMTTATKTATHVQNLLDISAPHLPNNNIVWWVWHSTTNRNNPMSLAKWEIIKNFNFSRLVH